MANFEQSAFSGGGDSKAGDAGLSGALASFVTHADYAEKTLMQPAQEAPKEFGPPPQITGKLNSSDLCYTAMGRTGGPGKAAREAADEKLFANV